MTTHRTDARARSWWRAPPGARTCTARRDRHLPRRPRDVPRLVAAAAAASRCSQSSARTIWDKDKVVLVIDHYVPERRRRVAPHRAHRARLGARRSGCRMSTTRWASATWSCRSTATSGRACSASAAIRIRRPAARSAPTCSASARPRCSASSSPARSGCRCRETIFMQWDGRLADGVVAKDMMLAMLGRFGMNGGAVPGGRVLRRGRAGAVDAGADDARQHERRARRAGRPGRARRRPRATGWPRTARRTSTSRRGTATTGAPGARHRFDAATLAPQVALPHSPANARGVDAARRRRRSTSPTSAPAPAPSSTTCARRRACSRGRRVAPRRAPAGRAGERAATRARPSAKASCSALLDAGATLLPSACGACAGYGEHACPRAAPSSRSTARNFKGRMGAADGAGVPRLALHRRRVGACAARSAIRASCSQ